MNCVRELAISGPLSRSINNRRTPGYADRRLIHHSSRQSATKSLVSRELPKTMLS